MTPPLSHTTLLAKIAPWSSTTWRSLGARAFPGERRIATRNSVYRLRDGVFIGRARRPARAFEAPKEMRGMRLIGFLQHDGRLWSLSEEWAPGAHAVLWTPGGVDEASFIFTSASASFTLQEPEPKPQPGPKPEPWLGRRAPLESGVMQVTQRTIARPPSFRAPLPPSMTRIHPAADLPNGR